MKTEVRVTEQKCPLHGRKLDLRAPGVPSFSWATGYSSLDNLDPLKPMILVCPERGCDYRELMKR